MDSDGFLGLPGLENLFLGSICIGMLAVSYAFFVLWPEINSCLCQSRHRNSRGLSALVSGKSPPRCRSHFLSVFNTYLVVPSLPGPSLVVCWGFKQLYSCLSSAHQSGKPRLGDVNSRRLFLGCGRASLLEHHPSSPKVFL